LLCAKTSSTSEEVIRKVMLQWERPPSLVVFFLSNPVYKMWAKRKVSRLDIKPGSIVLDFGCGTGIFSYYLAKKVGPHGRVFAIDISESLIQLAKKQLKRCLNVEIKLGEIWQLDFDPESIDEIFIHYVLHEMPQKKRYKAVLEFLRILKKAGKIRIFEPRPPHGIPVKGVEAIFKRAGLKQNQLNLSWRSFSAVYLKK